MNTNVQKDEAPVEPPADMPAEPDDSIERQLVAFGEQVSAVVDEWCAGVRENASGVIEDIIDGAASAHERLISDVDWSASDAAFAYRKGFREQVVAPLETKLEEAAVEDRVHEAYKELTARLAEKPEDLPPQVTRREPEALFQPEPGDRAGRRMRKARVRLGRTWRRGVQTIISIPRSFKGQEAEAPPGPTQTIPLRQLAEYHARVRLPAKVEIVQEGLHQVLGSAVADVARAVTEHGHEVLLFERGETLEGTEKDIRQAASDFVDVLRKAELHAAIDDIVTDAENVCAGAVEELRRDVKEAGTFMLDLSERRTEEGGAARDDREEVWKTWHSRVRTRITLTDTLLALREETLAIGASLAEHVMENAVDPARRAMLTAEASLRRIEKKAAAEFRAQEKRAMAERVSRYLDEAEQSLDREAITRLREANYPQQARDAAETTISEMATSLHQLPEKVEVNALRAPEERIVDPTAAALVVELREHASRAYDALVLRRLQTATSVVADGLLEARETVEGIPDILRFNLEASLEEADSSGDLSAARELAIGGLERSANVLREASQALSDLFEPYRAQIGDVIEYGFDRLHERLRVEVRMRGQILDLRSGALDQLRDVSTQAAEQARKSSVMLRRAYQRGMRRGRMLLRMGQAAAGLAEATEEERLETVEALADVGRLTEQLPLVYRRLFSFQPSTDPAMLIGREADLAFIRKHVDLWLRGLTNVLVLHGYHGSGLTSILNIAGQSILQDADTSGLELRTRIRDEEELARRLTQTLGIESADTLAAVEEQILAMDPTGIRACIVEHIEHLYLRQIGGTELIEHFLTFMSSTDAKILWIVTTSDTAWQVISKAEPAAAGLVTAHGLAPISRSDLESIVQVRHKRSGLPLRFEPPETELNPIVARRYRRANSEQGRQAILREEYFDRLHRISGQNIMLALLYWLRSVEMDTEEGELRVRPLEPLNFLALEKFDLDRAFAIRALLEHTSLTVEEYSEIAHVPLEMSIQMFQTLGNLLLIEPFESENKGQFQFVPIEKGVRYRIRPLVIHPVTRFLRSRNILH